MADEQYILPLAVLQQDNKLLLVFKHTSSAVMCTNKWELPGSRVDFGVSLEDSLIAKTKRSLGVDITVKAMLPRVYSSISDRSDGTGQMQFFVIPFLCEMNATDLILDESKLREARWFTLPEIEELHTKGELVDKNNLDIAQMVLGK